jgi:hypothetical protein
MSIFRHCLLFSVVTGVLLAQQDPPAKDLLNSALMQRAIDGIVAGSKAKPHAISVPQAKTSSPCSVPLLNAQIPSGVEFAMQQFHPSKDKMDSMQVIVPAPACTDSR